METRNISFLSDIPTTELLHPQSTYTEEDGIGYIEPGRQIVEEQGLTDTVQSLARGIREAVTRARTTVETILVSPIVDGLDQPTPQIALMARVIAPNPACPDEVLEYFAVSTGRYLNGLDSTTRDQIDNGLEVHMVFSPSIRSVSAS